MASLSRQLARWVVGLRYDDLPPAVIDRAKGVTLHCLSSILIGSQTRPAQEAVEFISQEEAGVHNGATIMVHGGKATKGGAAFANSEMAFAGGKWDTFRMLTHPVRACCPAPSRPQRQPALPAKNSLLLLRRATRSWSASRRILFRH